MPKTAGVSMLSQVDFYSTTTTSEHSLGQLLFDQLGRGYRFVLAGGSALVIGNVIQAAAEDANFKDMVVQAAVATSVAPSVSGGYAIPVTLGGTATTTASDFAGGTLTISVTPGIGQTFTIIGNDIQATTNGTCNFYVVEKPQVALTTSSKATAYHSPFWKVIQQPTTQTGISVGGAVTAIASAAYGWIQTIGAGSVLGDATATTAAAMAMSPSVTTAGAATKQVSLSQTIGVSLSTASVSAQVEGIYWRCF